MTVHTGITRRTLVSAAATALVIGNDRQVFSQPAKRIEQYAPELDNIISISEPVQELASGTGGTLGPTEGPLWWKEGRYILYTDIHNTHIMTCMPSTIAS